MSPEPQPQESLPATIDRSVKALVRQVPDVFLRLAGYPVDPGRLRFEDIALNLPELRADHVLIVDAEDDPIRKALHLEYQLEPDASSIPTWMLKKDALTRQLGLPVILVVVYLFGAGTGASPSPTPPAWAPSRTSFASARSGCGSIRSGSKAGSSPSLHPCWYCAKIIRPRARCVGSGS
jgi:hypothetical protein